MAGPEVKVYDNNIERALKTMKKKMASEGLFREMKRRRSYEKPSERRKRKNAEGRKRLAKAREQSG